ncbi:hypothetical protein PI125_g14783 [Phytophthora idaei]|nr:hypothetical protein PI125_g14783 [Phytophthora idaei]KAG3127003.1 hypothetical protein PI126_g22074 [Phytophthora idaei]
MSLALVSHVGRIRTFALRQLERIRAASKPSRVLLQQFCNSKISRRKKQRNPFANWTTTPKRNLSRDRQRLEILQLRAEAELLQQRVVELEKKQQEYEDAAFEMTMSGRRNGLLFDRWKRLANKYQELRREAETENRQLCAIYARHVATIEMLRRLLQLHEQAKKIPRSAARYFVHTHFDPDAVSLETMTRLHGGLDQLYAETDRVLLSNGLGVITSPIGSSCPTIKLLETLSGTKRPRAMWRVQSNADSQRRKRKWRLFHKISHWNWKNMAVL